MINKQANSDDGIYTSEFQQENGITDFTDPLWTVDDMAGYLQLQPETIRSMARRGELPAIKLGKVWRFRKTAIQEMLVERIHETLPDMLIPTPVTVIPGEDA